MTVCTQRCNQAGARLMLALALFIATWLMLTPAAGPAGGWVNDKLAHLITFWILALLAHASWPRPHFHWHLWLPLLAYGAAIEGLQSFIPTRSCSLLDLIADAAGLGLYALTRHLRLFLRP